MGMMRTAVSNRCVVAVPISSIGRSRRTKPSRGGYPTQLPLAQDLVERCRADLNRPPRGIAIAAGFNADGHAPPCLPSTIFFVSHSPSILQIPLYLGMYFFTRTTTKSTHPALQSLQLYVVSPTFVCILPTVFFSPSSLA